MGYPEAQVPDLPTQLESWFRENDITRLQRLIYQANKEKGFWPAGHQEGDRLVAQQVPGVEEDWVLADLPARNVGEAIALITTELSEALETFRKHGFDGPSNVLPEIPHFTEELADAVIRIFDLAGGFGLNLALALRLKLRYNLSRPPKHGKQF